MHISTVIKNDLQLIKYNLPVFTGKPETSHRGVSGFFKKEKEKKVGAV